MKPASPLAISTPSEREIVITRTFEAPRTLIFDCHVKPELVRRWLLGPPGWTMPICEIDARTGGSYRYVWQGANGEAMGMGGVFREVTVPERLVATQLFDQDWTGGEALGTLELNERHGTTTLVNTVLYASRAARDGALSTNMTEGMEAGFRRLEALLAEAAMRV